MKRTNCLDRVGGVSGMPEFLGMGRHDQNMWSVRAARESVFGKPSSSNRGMHKGQRKMLVQTASVALYLRRHWL
jgi:hypothetical protein